MPSGTIPMPSPWSPRPATIGTTEDDSAHTTEPRTSGAVQARMRRFLPYMSPRRPATGVAMAAVSSVTVMTHVVLEPDAPSRVGRSPISGTTSVCMSAATMPASASVAMMMPGRALGLGVVALIG
jgi:hypothetical protein